MIETNGLTKKYGELFAIRDINLSLSEGDVFGFIGPNGAGKTTTMRILATLLTPTWGEAYVGGQSIYTDPKAIRRMIGYMPDFFGVYDDMKVIEYLEFFAAAYRIRGEARKKICDEVLQLVDLEFKRHALANTLSRGQTQRLGLARVLLHDPKVLLLDEPASGLDPRARIDMRNLVKRLGAMGKTIMVSSHILPELADICNKVGIIEKGELEYNATVAELMGMLRKRKVMLVGIADEPKVAEQTLRDQQQVESVVAITAGEAEGAAQFRVTLREGVDDPSRLAAALIQADHRLTYFAEEEIDLETAFMELTKGEVREEEGGNAEAATA